MRHGIAGLLMSRLGTVSNTLYVQRGITPAVVSFATTQSITLPTAPTNGNKLILIGSAGNILDTPSGWSLDQFETNNSDTRVFSKTSNGTETTVNVTAAGSSFHMAGILYEFKTYTTFDQTAKDFVGQGSTTDNWGPSGTTTAANELVLAIGAFGYGTAGASPLPIISITPGFTIDSYVESVEGGAEFDGLTVGMKFITSTGTQSATITWTVATPALATTNFILVTYK